MAVGKTVPLLTIRLRLTWHGEIFARFPVDLASEGTPVLQVTYVAILVIFVYEGFGQGLVGEELVFVEVKGKSEPLDFP